MKVRVWGAEGEVRQRDGETDVWMTCAFVWRGIEALFDANSEIYIRQKTAGEAIATVSSDRLGSGQARSSDYILDSHRSIAPQHVDILDHVCSALGSSMSLHTRMKDQQSANKGEDEVYDAKLWSIISTAINPKS